MTTDQLSIDASPEAAHAEALLELERRLAEAEGAARAITFASGADAADAVFAEIAAGQEVVASTHASPILRAALARLASRGVRVVWVETHDPVAIAGALTISTRAVLVGVPSGPSLEIADLRALAAITRLASAKLIVDASPWTAATIKPLELGADASLITDPAALIGATDARFATVALRDTKWAGRIARWRDERAAPDDAEVARAALGLDTLTLRTQRRELAALLLARRLSESPHIRSVWFPGLDTFPQRSLVRSISAGLGPVLAVDVRGGAARVDAVLERLQLWSKRQEREGSLTGGNRSLTWIDEGSGRLILSPGLDDPARLIDELLWALRTTAELAQVRARTAVAEESSEAA